jgi:hypothetical protein
LAIAVTHADRAIAELRLPLPRNDVIPETLTGWPLGPFGFRICWAPASTLLSLHHLDVRHFLEGAVILLSTVISLFQ